MALTLEQKSEVRDRVISAYVKAKGAIKELEGYIVTEETEVYPDTTPLSARMRGIAAFNNSKTEREYLIADASWLFSLRQGSVPYADFVIKGPGHQIKKVTDEYAQQLNTAFTGACEAGGFNRLFNKHCRIYSDSFDIWSVAYVFLKL